MTEMEEEWVPGATNPPVGPLSQPQLDTTARVDLAAASEQAAQIALGFERLAQKYAAIGSARDAEQTTGLATTANATTSSPVYRGYTGDDVPHATERSQQRATETGLQHPAAAVHRIPADFELGKAGDRAEAGWRHHQSGRIRASGSGPSQQSRWGGNDATEKLPERDDPRRLVQHSGAHTREQVWGQNDQHEREHELVVHHGSHPTWETQAIEPARQAWSDSDRARRERYGSLGGTLAGLGGLSPCAEETRETEALRQRQQLEELKRALETQMHEQKTRADRGETVGEDRPRPHRRFQSYQGNPEKTPDWWLQPEPEPKPEPELEAKTHGSQDGVGVTSRLSSPEPRQPQQRYYGVHAHADSEHVHPNVHDLFRHQDERQEALAAASSADASGVLGAANAATNDVDARLDVVGRRTEKLLRASEEIEEGIAAEADQFSDDEDWLPSPAKPLRVRNVARTDPYSIVEASLGGRPSSFIGFDSTLSPPLPTDLGVHVGRRSVALESTSRFVDIQARFDELFQDE